MSTQENQGESQSQTQGDGVSNRSNIIPSKTKRKPMSKRSSAWDHFELFVNEENEKKTRCVHCSREFHCD